MKIYKFLLMLSITLFLFSCSEDVMDEVNENQNDPTDMVVKNLLPDAILKSAYETTGTDIAWFTDIYIEYAAGTWAQASDADKRLGQESASLFNNNWNSLYDVMNICKVIIDKTDPITGSEPINYGTRGVAQILMAYNLAVATDMWGEIPYTEAFKGSENLQPKYDRQSDLYTEIHSLLDDAILNLEAATSIDGADFIYDGDVDLWIMAAHSLKARYYMRMTNVSTTAAADALAEIADGFASAGDQMIFNQYVDDLPNGNPWFEYWYLRDHNSISSTIIDLLNARNDPREGWYHWGGDIAPIGEASQTQGGYSQSTLTTGWRSWNSPTPMMTYHELLFIKAEAEFRTGAAPAVWQATLEDAITAQFTWLSTYMLFDWTTGDPNDIGDAAAYFADEVLPLLTPGNELNEIMTQKYLGLFEMECIETYNDYRRTGIPTMQNPNNATVGFLNRFPYALSETSSNPDNVPSISVYEDKVWWAGGTEN